MQPSIYTIFLGFVCFACRNCKSTPFAVHATLSIGRRALETKRRFSCNLNTTVVHEWVPSDERNARALFD